MLQALLVLSGKTSVTPLERFARLQLRNSRPSIIGNRLCQREPQNVGHSRRRGQRIEPNRLGASRTLRTCPKLGCALQSVQHAILPDRLGASMVCHVRTGRVRLIWVASAVFALTGCTETVWVRPGATPADSEAAMEQCLSDAYLQAPSAPKARTLGSDVAPPSFTTCSGLGFSGACISSRGQYTRPLTVRHDANARIRSQTFRQCMLASNWSEQTRVGGSATPAAEDDWTKGFDAGIRGGTDTACTIPPVAVVDARSWSLGCQSGQKAR